MAKPTPRWSTRLASGFGAATSWVLLAVRGLVSAVRWLGGALWSVLRGLLLWALRPLRRRWVRWLLAVLAVVSAIFVAWSYGHVAADSAPRVYGDVAEVPRREVGLVLGTNPLLSSGQPNPFFDYRMDAAAALWRAGKVRLLLVSGDNGRDEYDEVSAMRSALVARGVAASAIILDYAGFRTLDSVVRCRSVFGVLRPVVVSQRWHAERAIFLAQAQGMDAIGFAARDLSARAAVRSYLREYLARAKAVLDVAVLHTQPRFPGPPEPIAGLAEQATATSQ